LIELFGAEFLFTLILEKAYNRHHQKEDAEKVKEYPFV